MDGTKYNLSITTSGENGDHASTNISTSNPAQLADILQLAGMQDAHPIALGDVPQSFEAPAPEEHGSCDVCGGMHEDDEHVVEGDSWDNEPNGATEVVHSPEELSQTGNDLHKVKKTYPKVNGGDNPMALENTENKLRQQFADFLAEDMEEEITEEVELVSPWKKQDTSIEIVEEEEPIEEAQSPAQKAAFQKMLDAKNGKKEETTENKNMTNIRKLIDNLDSINSSGTAVVTEATTAELQARIAALQKQIAAQQNQGPEGGSDEQYGSYTDADYDDQGNLIREPLDVFGKAEKNSGPEGGSDEQYGSLPRQKTTPRTDTIRARAEGLQARLAAAREAGYSSLKDARAGGHPSGSEHTWTGSGAYEVDAPIAGADQVSRDSKWAPGDDRNPGNLGATEKGNMMGDPELQDIVKLAGAPGGKHPDELGIGLAKDNRAGSKIDYSQGAQADRQRARAIANAAGGGPEGSSDEKYGSAEFDKDGKIIGEPFKGPFTKAPKQTGRENNQSGGSATYDDDTSKYTSGNLTSKPLKVFTKAPKQKGRDE